MDTIQAWKERVTNALHMFTTYVECAYEYCRVHTTKHDGRYIVQIHPYLKMALREFHHYILMGYRKVPGQPNIKSVDDLVRYRNLLRSINTDYGSVFWYSAQMLQYRMGIDSFPPAEVVIDEDTYRYARGKPESRVS